MSCPLRHEITIFDRLGVGRGDGRGDAFARAGRGVGRGAGRGDACAAPVSPRRPAARPPLASPASRPCPAGRDEGRKDTHGRLGLRVEQRAVAGVEPLLGPQRRALERKQRQRGALGGTAGATPAQHPWRWRGHGAVERVWGKANPRLHFSNFQQRFNSFTKQRKVHLF